MSAPDGITSHQGNHHLGHRTDQPLEIEDIQPRHSIIAHVSGLTANTLIPSRTECIFAIGVGSGSGQQHNPDRLILAGVTERIHISKRSAGGTHSVSRDD